MPKQTTSFAALASLLLFACADESSQPLAETETPGENDGGVTEETGLAWSTDIAPILNEQCVGCHTEGGAGPFGLDTFDDVRTYASVALDSMESGRMPPWQPDPECRDLEGARLMPAEEIATFREWIEAGMLEGPALEVEPPELAAFEPTHVAGLAEPYTPDLDRADDYRCFLMDLEFEEDMYLEGRTVVPGNGLVHHVLVYALNSSQSETARELDEAEGGIGYTCFGGPVPLRPPNTTGGLAGIGALLAGLAFPEQLGAWVPGASPAMYEDGTAIRIEAGSTIVMQVHYSAVAGNAEPDAGTEFQAILTTDEPDRLARTLPVAEQSFEVAAGDANGSTSMTVEYYGEEPLQIDGLMGHMHLLGTRIAAEVVRVDGAEECGLDIPDWDFSWQEAYTLAAGSEIVLQSGDAIRLTCEYDNSAANQPVVNGVQQEAVDISWGDGTLDEMCLLYVNTLTDFTESNPPGSPPCSANCAEQCGDDFECMSRCEGSNVGCFGCALSEGFECGLSDCLAELAPAQRCLGRCVTGSIMLSSNFGVCMETTCTEAYEPAIACVSEVMARPECEAAREACGL